MIIKTIVKYMATPLSIPTSQIWHHQYLSQEPSTLISTPAQECGFTLIELLVVIAIIAILAAIAYPSYTSFIIKARRLDATAALSGLQLEQVKYRSRCPSYATSIGIAESHCDGKISYPEKSENEYYDISVVSGPSSATGFELRATPVSGKSQAGDSNCSPYLSVKVNGGEEEYGPADQCWGKL